MAGDSVSKIVESYFSSVTWTEFSYKKKIHRPKILRVSPSVFFKTMTCVAGCGGCCHRFSLDYLPDEVKRVSSKSLNLAPRSIEFDGRIVEIYSDCQTDNADHYCRHLQKNDGRCGIHQSHPFSCDFELLRFSCSDDSSLFGHRSFGRAWQMLKINGERGADCEWKDSSYSETQKNDVVRKLRRLKEWSDYFGLAETALPTMIDLIERGPFFEVQTITPPVLKKKGLF